MEVRSTRKCGSIVDRSHIYVSGPKSPCACWSSARQNTLGGLGRCASRCEGGMCHSLLACVLMLTLIDTQSLNIKPSVAGYIAKSVALVGKEEKYDGYRACDIAFERFHLTHVSFILLMKVCIPFSPTAPLLASSYCLGCHHVYCRGSNGCDIARRRPHRNGALQLHMLCGSGTCITPSYTVNVAHPR